MAVLVPSLRALFNELDATWSNRDHRTDGWIGDRKHCPGASDHCVDSQGRVHAIDIDKDGIDPNFVVERLTNYEGVIRYMNWNRQQFHVRNDFRPIRYTGSNPHTDHVHVSIEHTDLARNYQGPYGIFSPPPPIRIVVPELSLTPQTEWDHSEHIVLAGNTFAGMGDTLSGYRGAFAALRN